MLKYIFGLVFIALAWAAVLVFEQLPTWPAWVATGVVVFVLALITIVKLVKAKRSAGAIESALAAGSGRQGAVRPELQAQVDAMRAEFDKALRSLKASKTGKHGGSALAVLPWYVIIGPPGSGKSTLLRNSGLRFPYLSAKKGAVKGIGGTRNCDWWLSNDGILLDTAGRWSVEEEDADEWLAFLDLLKRTRKRKAINGVLVAISADQLLTTDEGEAADLAARLRERLDELTGRLGVSVPVYLLVTKCDLVAGFAETFSTLGDKDRGQIWGFTLPMDAPAEERSELFVDRLAHLVDVLELRALERLGEERRIDERQRIYQFPQEFEGLCPNLVALARDMFSENVYADTPVLRGVYFTSGTQEGRPVDRIMKKMAEAFGLRAQPLPAERPKAKAYFLAQVFKDVVFPDQDAAGMSSKSLKQQRLVGLGIAAGSVLVAGGLALTPALAYSRNRALVEDARALVRGLDVARTPRGELGAGRPLEALAPTVDRLWTLATEGPALSMTFGFYQGDKLAVPVARALRQSMVVPLATKDLETLKALTGSKAGSIDDARERLTRYLLLSSPRAAEEPPVDEKTWLTKLAPGLRDGMVDAWKRRRIADGQAVSELAARTYGRMVDLYVHEAVEDDGLWLARDVEAVEHARTAIRAMADQDPLLLLTSSPELAENDTSLGRLLGGAIVLFREDAKVDGAFTKPGYDTVKTRLASLESGEPITGPSDDEWVLGPRKPLAKEQIDGLRGRYFEGYERQWRSMLAAVYPRGPADLTEAQSLLRRHQDERPLVLLFKALAENLDLQSKLEAMAGQATQGTLDKLMNRIGGKRSAAGGALDAQRAKLAKTPDGLKSKFAAVVAFGAPSAKEGAPPPPIDAYYQQLAKLQQAIVAYDDSKDTKALRKEVTMAKQQVAEMAMRYGRDGWEPMLSKMLMPMVTGVEELVVGAGDEAANRAWCDAVVLPFDELLKERYPFRLDGPDAPIAEVEKYFQPKSGTLWAHYEDVLKQDLDQIGKRFRLKTKPSVNYKSGALSFLSQALRVTELLFPPGADKLQPALEVRLRSATGAAGTASRVTLRLGAAKPLEYGNWTERWEKAVWPARGAKIGILGDMKGLPKELGAEGDWGLFRLLDRAMRTPGREQDEFLRAEWTLPTPNITARMDVKPADLLEALHAFDVPRSVAPGSSPCAKPEK